MRRGKGGNIWERWPQYYDVGEMRHDGSRQPRCDTPHTRADVLTPPVVGRREASETDGERTKKVDVGAWAPRHGGKRGGKRGSKCESKAGGVDGRKGMLVRCLPVIRCYASASSLSSMPLVSLCCLPPRFLLRPDDPAPTSVILVSPLSTYQLLFYP